MKTNIYFLKTNAFNAVIFDQENGHYFMTEGDHNGYIDGTVDLYSDNATDSLKEYFINAINNGDVDITGLCNSTCVIGGNFDPDENGTESILIASYDDIDTADLVEGPV